MFSYLARSYLIGRAIYISKSGGNFFESWAHIRVEQNNILIYNEHNHKFQGMKIGNISMSDFWQKGHFAGEYQDAIWKV